MDNLSYYVRAVETYLTLPKDVGFDYMETIVAEIEEEFNVSWTDAYTMFGELVDESLGLK
jgi:hypothetical protein